MLLALISLFVISKLKTVGKVQRRVYTRKELLEKNYSSVPPKDWKNIPVDESKIKSPSIENSLPTTSAIHNIKEETLELFILKEIENSVKELEQKRIPFSNLDSNILSNRFNPSVEEFIPKVRLNPLAQDFHPY